MNFLDNSRCPLNQLMVSSSSSSLQQLFKKFYLKRMMVGAVVVLREEKGPIPPRTDQLHPHNPLSLLDSDNQS